MAAALAAVAAAKAQAPPAAAAAAAAAAGEDADDGEMVAAAAPEEDAAAAATAAAIDLVDPTADAHTADVHARVLVLKQAGKWSAQRLPKLAEPSRHKVRVCVFVSE